MNPAPPVMRIFSKPDASFDDDGCYGRQVVLTRPRIDFCRLTQHEFGRLEDQGFFFFVAHRRRGSWIPHLPAERKHPARRCPGHVDLHRASPSAMIRIVHLARHGSHAEVGQVLSGRSDIALSEKGRAEAAQLAERLAGTPLRAIHSSPRARARETAAIVAARHGIVVEVSDALDEIDFGEWAGSSFTTLHDDPRWREWNLRRGSGSAPGGETMVGAIARARVFLEQIAETEVLCVSHCDVIRGLVASYLGLDLDRVLAFDCDPGSLTTLSLGYGEARIVTLNEQVRSVPTR